MNTALIRGFLISLKRKYFFFLKKMAQKKKFFLDKIKTPFILEAVDKKS
jgi:hypothetical protein